MTHSIFGWSYPPGCSGPPDEDFDDSEPAPVFSSDELDPYGSLTFAIGTGEDFVCMDYRVSDDKTVVEFASTLNSETGSFIQAFCPNETVPAAEAIAYAQGLVCDALDWTIDNELPRLDMKGWNQDPTWFVRCVRASLAPVPYKSPPCRVRQWRKDLV